MRPTRTLKLLAVAAMSASLITLSACGAGSRTAADTATQVACDFENPAEATTVNVLAYNSSAVDPFTNTMVKSCTHDNVTVKHDPIDFGGQVQKTVASLSGDKGLLRRHRDLQLHHPDLRRGGEAAAAGRPVRQVLRRSTSWKPSALRCAS